MRLARAMVSSLYRSQLYTSLVSPCLGLTPCRECLAVTPAFGLNLNTLGTLRRLFRRGHKFEGIVGGFRGHKFADVVQPLPICPDDAPELCVL